MMNTEFTLYEFCYKVEGRSQFVRVVAHNREEAMHKLLDNRPEIYDFRCTGWWPIDIP